MAFINIRFPDNISVGSSGGPAYSTTVTVPRSGYAARNINWTYPRHEYDVAYGVRLQSDMEDLIAFFHIMQGRGNTFRYKDWADFKSCDKESTPAAADQTIGTGDGSETDYQLIKYYTYSSTSRLSRVIDKPVSGTILVSVNAVAQTEGAGNNYTVDYSSGIITFNAGSIPAMGHLVRAGFEFDVHCAFDDDKLSVQLEDYNAGSATCPVVEQKPEAS